MLKNCAVSCLLLAASLAGLARAEAPRIVEVRKIWDQGPHNAFTDLVWHNHRWLCVFREASGHVTMDGAIRVLTSADGKVWKPEALLKSATEDLRDPKLSVTPDGRLMLLAAGATHPPKGPTRQSYVWFSKDGHDWSKPAAVGDYNYWLWRVTWFNKACYGMGYKYVEPRDLRFYRSTDGIHFEHEPESVLTQYWPNETSLVFLPDGTCLALVRREKGPATGLLGRAEPPYHHWEWKELDRRIGGPHLIRLPDGRLIAAVRLHDGKVRTALCWLNAETGKLEEFLTLPSGGDTSYAGLVWHEGLALGELLLLARGEDFDLPGESRGAAGTGTAVRWRRQRDPDRFAARIAGGRLSGGAVPRRRPPPIALAHPARSSVRDG